MAGASANRRISTRRRFFSCPRRRSLSPARCSRSTAAGVSAKDSTDMRYALGIDLGGTSIKAVSVTPDGKLLGQDNRPFDPDIKLHWGETIRAVAAELQ